MTVDSEKELNRLKRIGKIVGLTLQEMISHLQPGMTTGELDAIGMAFLREHGARSAPMLSYNFPGATCISINDEAAHGIPGERVIQPGDLVNIDVSAELDGYFADTGASIPVPPVSEESQRLCNCTRSALRKAIRAAVAGRPLNSIGQAVEEEAQRCGFRIIRALHGHGVGHKLHEEPSAVASYYNPHDHRRLLPGMVIAIEPFLSAGEGQVAEAADGWTLKTLDGSRLAQFEHTIVVTRGQPIILTAV